MEVVRTKMARVRLAWTEGVLGREVVPAVEEGVLVVEGDPLVLEGGRHVEERVDGRGTWGGGGSCGGGGGS